MVDSDMLSDFYPGATGAFVPWTDETRGCARALAAPPPYTPALSAAAGQNSRDADAESRPRHKARFDADSDSLESVEDESPHQLDQRA